MAILWLASEDEQDLMIQPGSEQDQGNSFWTRFAS